MSDFVQLSCLFSVDINAATWCQSSSMMSSTPAPVTESLAHDPLSAPVTGTSDTSIDIETTRAIGGHDISCKGKFLERKDVVNILTSRPVTLENIPVGFKENQYFCIDNTRNLERLQSKLCSEFNDDCGLWATGSSRVDLFNRLPGDVLVVVFYRDSQFCTLCYKRVRGRRKLVFTPFAVQPNPADIIRLHQLYYKHSLNGMYMRRISWIANETAAIAEYVVSSSVGTPNGYCGLAVKHVRTKPQVIGEAKRRRTDHTPTRVQDALDEKCTIVGPRRGRDVTRDLEHVAPAPRHQLYEHIPALNNLVYTHEFVQVLTYGSSHAPIITLYVDDQLQDIKRFCCSAPDAYTTPLGFKTFNLGSVYVTWCTFKNLSVMRRDTNEHPTFGGPVWLHGNSDFASYHSFLSHLSGILFEEPSPPIIGTGDGVAMKEAIQLAFRRSPILSCTQHIEKIIDKHLRDKIGVCKKDRSSIVASTIAVTNADDQTTFDYRLELTHGLIKVTAPSFSKYFRIRIVPLLRSNFNTSISQNTPSLVNWTNDNCESMNAILDNLRHWKTQSPIALILKIYEVMTAQYEEVRGALVGHGDYMLCPLFQCHAVPVDTWATLTQEKKNDHYQEFLQQTAAINSKTATSAAEC